MNNLFIFRRRHSHQSLTDELGSRGAAVARSPGPIDIRDLMYDAYEYATTA